MWQPKIAREGKPLYVAIADAVAEDIGAGRLQAGERLPGQRELAAQLGIDFTTVTRAYAEAKRRGLVVGRAGQGTFVCGHAPRPADAPPELVDMSMNAPPKPADPALALRLRQGLVQLGQGFDLDRLMAYGPNAGAPDDRVAGVRWLKPRLPDLEPDRLLITPGGQGGLLVLLLMLAAPGEVIYTEALTYPGMKALCGQLGLKLEGLAMDAEGLDPDALRAACQRQRPKAIYCTPTFHNPTTATMSLARRRAIVAVAREFGVPIIEDDAYGRLPRQPLPPLAALAPELTYLVCGLAKTVAPGLRLAYLIAPDARQAQRAVTTQRATTLMASPLTAALASRWIGDGTAEQLLTAIRDEAAARQAVARAVLPAAACQSRPEAFHLWLNLPAGWPPADFMGQLAARQIRAAGADAFSVSGDAPAGLRICLGNLPSRALVRPALDGIAALLRSEPADLLVV